MINNGILELLVLNHCATGREIAGADPGHTGHAVANREDPLHRALH